MMPFGMCWDSQLIQAVTVPGPHKNAALQKQNQTTLRDTGVQMRRVIAAAVVSVLVFGGVTAIPAFAASSSAEKADGADKHDAGKAQPAARAKAKNMAKNMAKKTKTVVYRGYEFRVPANWPVYRLDEYPSTCVRYDINAVYLGTPGVNMRCSAGVVGRAQTVSVIPSTTIAAGSGSEVTYQRAQPDGVGGTRVRSLSAVPAAITRNAGQHELRVALGVAALGATILGTYGGDPAVVEQVLATLRAAPAGAPATAQTGSSRARSRTAALAPARSMTAALAQALAPARASASAQPTSSAWHGVPPDWPIQIVVGPRPKPKPRSHPVNGFDSCTAPSLHTMRVWRRAYAAVGVYIGGVNSGCAFGNLSASWMRSAAGMGWGMLPTYVGPQAPCWGYHGVTINPSQAAAEGRAAGQDAVRDARLFGLGAGSPIYYDMEAYNAAYNATCKTAVLTFLGAWDRAAAQAGYVTGVYSSQDSGIADMQAATIAKKPGFTPPDAVWFALWDGVSSLSDGSLAWPLADRAKQYSGNVYATVGGITLNIDRDIVGGPLAR